LAQPIFRTLKIEYQGGRRNANPPGVKL